MESSLQETPRLWLGLRVLGMATTDAIESMRLGIGETTSTIISWLFTFYHRYVYKVLPIKGELYIFVKPELLVRVMDFKSLIEHAGVRKFREVLEEGITRNAYCESEGR